MSLRFDLPAGARGELQDQPPGQRLVRDVSPEKLEGQQRKSIAGQDRGRLIELPVSKPRRTESVVIFVKFMLCYLYA
jgi:hypothetical protein